MDQINRLIAATELRVKAEQETAHMLKDIKAALVEMGEKLGGCEGEIKGATFEVRRGISDVLGRLLVLTHYLSSLVGQAGELDDARTRTKITEGLLLKHMKGGEKLGVTIKGSVYGDVAGHNVVKSVVDQSVILLLVARAKAVVIESEPQAENVLNALTSDALAIARSAIAGGPASAIVTTLLRIIDKIKEERER